MRSATASTARGTVRWPSPWRRPCLADLTELTEDNKGTFPEERVRNVIENGGPKGHGMMAMLAWGKVFNEELGGDSHKIIDELTAYIKKSAGAVRLWAPAGAFWPKTWEFLRGRVKKAQENAGF